MNDHTSKLNTALQLLNQRGLDGLIIYSDGTCSILRPSYLYYFAGFKPLGANNAIILSKFGNVTLLVEPRWDSIRASKKTWVRDTRSSSDFVKDLLGVMRELKIKGSVGIAGSREIREELYAAIKKEASIELADDIIEEIAREKTKKEVDVVRKAGRIADVGFKAFLEYTRLGIREYELTAEIDYAMRLAGAEDTFILLSSEKHNEAMHLPLDKRLMEGDIIIGEITPVYEGQFIQLCRTIVLGKPSPILIEKYNMLVHAFEESLKHIKSGVPASVISRAMNKIISEAGYAKYCYPPYMRARGHGLGVGSISPGAVIDDDNKINLERHQVVVVHPNQYLPETGYLACGETVLVTDTGAERLSETETKLYIKEV